MAERQQSGADTAGSRRGCALPMLAVALVGRLLRADPGQRPSAADVLAHPWIVSGQAKCLPRPAHQVSMNSLTKVRAAHWAVLAALQLCTFHAYSSVRRWSARKAFMVEKVGHPYDSALPSR